MAEKIIFVFPGQGAQYVGMGKDLYDNFAVARYTFEQISDLTHRDLARICFSGDTADLNKPENTSLGTFAHSVSIARIIEDEYITPLYDIGYAMAGHSMGQYSALHCVGSIGFNDTVNLLSARSTYMNDNDGHNGGMAVIVGLDYATVNKYVMMASQVGYVAISNYNTREQIVVSGDNSALDVVIGLANSGGAKIAKRLNVAVPAHCELMFGAKKRLQENLKKVPISVPRTNWFSNQTANMMSEPDEVRKALADQMVHGVRWMEIMEKFPVHNITRAYELGPGCTLTKFINRSKTGCVARSVDNCIAIKRILADLNNMHKTSER